MSAADLRTEPSGTSDALTLGRRALWAHVEHLHLRGLVQSHITARRRSVELLEAFLGSTAGRRRERRDRSRRRARRTWRA